MHYRYANYHLEGYTCSSFDSNLGVVKLKPYYFWSWGCFSWIAGWGHLSLTAARFVWSSESSDDCWKCYSETKVGNSWTDPTVKGRWVFFCILYSAVSWQLVACRKVLGFRSSIHAQALFLALEADFPVDFITWLLNEGFGFWDSSLMHKCESLEALSHCLRMCFSVCSSQWSLDEGGGETIKPTSAAAATSPSTRFWHSTKEVQQVGSGAPAAAFTSFSNRLWTFKTAV